MRRLSYLAVDAIAARVRGKQLHVLGSSLLGPSEDSRVAAASA